MSIDNPHGNNSSEETVREDPALLREEKQFSIVGTKADDKVTVYTEVGSVGRPLLVHPESKVTRKRCVDGIVVGIEAKIPISCLSVKSVPRKHNDWHAVVSSGGD